MPIDPDERAAGPSPTLHSLDKSIAVLQTKLDGFVDLVGGRLATIDTTIKDSLGTYATKAELKERDEAIAEIRGNIRWAVRIVISAVILAVLALVLKTGLLHG